jgi:hypothetical protein
MKNRLVLKPGTGTGTISKTRNCFFQERKILKPGIRNQKNYEPKTRNQNCEKNAKTKTRNMNRNS